MADGSCFLFQNLKKHLGDSFARVPQPYHGSIMKSRSIQNYPRPIQKQCPWCMSRFFRLNVRKSMCDSLFQWSEFCQDVEKNVERSMEITWDYITCLNMFSRLPTSLLEAFAWHIKPDLYLFKGHELWHNRWIGHIILGLSAHYFEAMIIFCRALGSPVDVVFVMWKKLEET